MNDDKKAVRGRIMNAPVLSMGRSSFRVTYDSSVSAAPDYIEITVEDDGSLTIRGFDGCLVIRPEVANMISIQLEDFAR